MGEGLEESPLMVLHEVIPVLILEEQGERREKRNRALLERLAIHPQLAPISH